MISSNKAALILGLILGSGHILAAASSSLSKGFTKLEDASKETEWSLWNVGYGKLAGKKTITWRIITERSSGPLEWHIWRWLDGLKRRDSKAPGQVLLNSESESQLSDLKLLMEIIEKSKPGIFTCGLALNADQQRCVVPIFVAPSEVYEGYAIRYTPFYLSCSEMDGKVTIALTDAGSDKEAIARLSTICKGPIEDQFVKGRMLSNGVPRSFFGGVPAKPKLSRYEKARRKALTTYKNEFLNAKKRYSGRKLTPKEQSAWTKKRANWRAVRRGFIPRKFSPVFGKYISPDLLLRAFDRTVWFIPPLMYDLEADTKVTQATPYNTFICDKKVMISREPWRKFELFGDEWMINSKKAVSEDRYYSLITKAGLRKLTRVMIVARFDIIIDGTEIGRAHV